MPSTCGTCFPSRQVLRGWAHAGRRSAPRVVCQLRKPPAKTSPTPIVAHKIWIRRGRDSPGRGTSFLPGNPQAGPSRRTLRTTGAGHGTRRWPWHSWRARLARGLAMSHPGHVAWVMFSATSTPARSMNVLARERSALRNPRACRRLGAHWAVCRRAGRRSSVAYRAVRAPRTRKSGARIGKRGGAMGLPVGSTPRTTPPSRGMAGFVRVGCGAGPLWIIPRSEAASWTCRSAGFPDQRCQRPACRPRS